MNASPGFGDQSRNQGEDTYGVPPFLDESNAPHQEKVLFLVTTKIAFDMILSGFHSSTS